MKRVLVPVDGSESSLRATEHAIGLSRRCAPLEIDLLNVQLPIASGHVRLFVSQAMIDEYHRAEGEAALAPAVRLLSEAGVRHDAVILVGHIAQTITEHAKARGCDAIVMGSRGLGAVPGLILGSVATRVVHLADIPVTLVK